MVEPSIVVKSPEGVSASLPSGTTAREALEALGSNRGRVVVARVDGALRDLGTVVPDGATVEPVLVRPRSGDQRKGVALDAFTAELAAEVARRR